jgi:uncharacterized membrane protein HdeD (DUF308 family)
MTEDLLDLPPDYKIHRERSIYIATLLGGILPGGIMIAANFRKMGLPKKANITLFITLALLAGFLLCPFFFPDMDGLPNMAAYFLYLLAMWVFIGSYQAAPIREHIEAKGPLYSTWWALLYGIAGTLIAFWLL